MYSFIGETVSCTTTIVPRWEATLIWDVEDVAFCSLVGLDSKGVSSDVTKIEQKAGKSLSWSISLTQSNLTNVNMNLFLNWDKLDKMKYCTYEVFVQRAGSESRKCLTEEARKHQPHYAEACFGYPSYRRYSCTFPLDALLDSCNGPPPEGASRFLVKLRIVFQEENRPGPVLLIPKRSTSSGEAWMPGLFNNETYSDITIECGGKSFFAHKKVLNQSPVIAKMFSTPMKEYYSKKITISDVNPTTMEFFLKSLYGVSYELPDGIEEILALINCAEKYDVMNIKANCFRKLAALLSDGNAAELNIAAYRFCHNEELWNIRDFFKNYCQERHKILVKNPDYCRLVKENFDAFM